MRVRNDTRHNASEDELFVVAELSCIKSQRTSTALPLRINASIAFYLPRCLCASLAAKLSYAIQPTVSILQS